LQEEETGAGLLAITSPDRLHAGWLAACRRDAPAIERRRAMVERILGPLARDAALVTVLDGHPAAHAWLARCAASAWCRSGSTISGRAAISRSVSRIRAGCRRHLDACAQALLGSAGDA